MPIRVQCPGCASSLNAPDAAAGKRLKCPKCQSSVLVPTVEPKIEILEPDSDYESIEVDQQSNTSSLNSSEADNSVEEIDENSDGAEPPPRKSKKNSDDSRPKKKKSKQKKSKGMNNSTLKFVGIGVGGMMLLGLCIVGGIFLIPNISNSPPPAFVANDIAWHRAVDKKGLVAIHFPGRPPKYEKFSFQTPEFLAAKIDKKAEDLG
ncbi:MAG: hypothetical protein ACRCZF_08690, partial [Gemmataceae bacterium]